METLSYPKNICENNHEILEEVINHINQNNLNYEQFNEVLLLLNENRISEGFYEFFFEVDKNEKIDFKKIKYGITKFRGYSFLQYGNIKIPLVKLSNKKKEEIEKELEDVLEKENELQQYLDRPDPIINIKRIEKEKTWYLGYISGGLLEKESNRLVELLSDPKFKQKKKLEPLSKLFSKLDEEIQEKRKIGKKNTDTYLNWDYIDVYIATSMRDRCDFEETYEFLEKISNDPEIQNLNLRFFDPTQSYTRLQRNKGLIEGLMLKRAKCTIYMVQERDTLGKDSELAATLAQKKPVIAYIPNYQEDILLDKIKKYPLEYIKKMILNYLSEDVFEVEKFSKILKWDKPKEQWGILRDKLIEITRKIDNYRIYEQSFKLWEEKDELFKKKIIEFDEICKILSIASKIFWSKREKTLKESHPLGLQIDIGSGVANGVIVVREYDTCIKILKQILTKSMEFEIKHVITEKNSEYTGLMEKNTGSLYRIITDDPHLTNSFWNFFFK